jgi:hypothetical protein
MFHAVAARMRRWLNRGTWLPPGADVAGDDWRIPGSLPTALSAFPIDGPPPVAFDQARRRLQREQATAEEECEWQDLLADSIAAPPVPRSAARKPPADPGDDEERQWQALLDKARHQRVALAPVKARAGSRSAAPVEPRPVPATVAPPADEDEGQWSALLARAKARTAATRPADEEREWKALLAQAKARPPTPAVPRRGPRPDTSDIWGRAIEQAKRRASAASSDSAEDDWAAALRRAKLRASPRGPSQARSAAGRR